MPKTAINLYNTLTRQKESFVPVTPGQAAIYVCGPTTYNYIHLGNARPIVVFDTVRRYLMHAGYEVIYIQNFTDVDDKIINKAAEEGQDPIALAAYYIDAFFADIKALNVLPATGYPKVSEHITEIVNFISELVTAGYAYATPEGDVYFAVRKYPAYGQLSGRNIDELMSGARVEVGESKADPLDFALWKAAKPGEPYWPSPWGNGRPGWHIECSAMSRKYLGGQFDIHGGGQDLIFPHHENEIAQSQCISGEPMAKYWMHNGYITIDNEKMSKSLGNFFLLRDILAKYDPQTVRFYLLSVQYRSPLDFSDDKLDVAHKSLSRLKNAYLSLGHGITRAGDHASAAAETLAQHVEATKAAFEAAMSDDFNTALAISTLFDLVRELNTYLKETFLDLATLEAAKATLDELLWVLGLDFAQTPRGDDALVASLIALTIDVRKEARASKQYALSDMIRDRLSALGIILEDGKDGTTWKYE